MSPQPFGTLLGYVSILGAEIPCYSNYGFINPHSNKNSYDSNGDFLGIQFQCVEFVRRYVLFLCGENIASFFNGNADGWYDSSGAMPLLKVSEPAIGDIACFDGGPFGHLAIIIDINSEGITIAQQNFFNDERDLAITFSNNTIVDGLGTLYTLKGFLRPRL